VGGAAQIKAMKEEGGPLRLTLAQYRELAAFSQFASDLDEATQRQLGRGARLTEILKQGQYEPQPVEQQVLHLLAGNQGFLDDLDMPQVLPFIDALTEHFTTHQAALLQEILDRGSLKKEGLKDRLIAEIKDFANTWNG
jgi:F-type H+-transporting ATPase subunit alpha